MFLLQSSIRLEKISPPEKVDMSSITKEKNGLEVLLSPHVAKRDSLSMLQDIWRECAAYEKHGRIDCRKVLDEIKRRFKKKVSKTDFYKSKCIET
jgi:hypothetical protein